MLSAGLLTRFAARSDLASMSSLRFTARKKDVYLGVSHSWTFARACAMSARTASCPQRFSMR